MKPTFVIVHGAWHSPSHFAHLIAQLQKLDYPAVAAKLPSVGSVSPLLQSVIQDTDSIKESFLNPLLEDGKDVILVTHSYGGVPGCAAVKGLSKAQRKNEGQRGGVIGIICISSYLVKEAPSMGGESGNWPPFCIVDEVTNQLTVENPIAVFYHDVDPLLAKEAEAMLLPQAIAAFTSVVPAPGWQESEFDQRRAYICCTEDATLPIEVQDMMVQQSGVEWIVRDFATSHSPFMSKPEETAGCLVDLADMFEKTYE